LPGATLATIGYERATLDGVIEKLQGAGVALVIDVRAVAASRRPGFSKSMLAASLDQSGIGYRHLRDLGTPKAGREAARAGRTGEMRQIFAAHMEEPAAQRALAEAAHLARDQACALLCYEAEARHCHRAIVAELIQAREGIEIVNL